MVASITMTMDLALTVFLLLTIKHAVCDLYLQSFLTLDKSRYLGGWPHYAEHALGTFVVIAWFVDPVIAVAIALLDGVAHGHIDWLKHRVISAYEHTTGMTMESNRKHTYWFVQAVDQMLHFLTYYLICLIIISQHHV